MLNILLIVIIVILILIIIFKKDYFINNKYINNNLEKISEHTNKLIPSKSQYGGSGDKGKHHHDYLSYYQKIFNRVKSNFKLLEIGIAEGYSIISFLRTYPNSTIYGVDINLKSWDENYNKFNITDSEKHRLNIINGDATHNSILNKIPNNLDIILDDGSHTTNDMINSFSLLFKYKLKKGGVYIIEDVHCYNTKHEFIDYIISLFPYVYKFNSFKECNMLSGHENIKNRIKLDWKYEIKDITISRDIVVITKEE